MRVGVVVYIYVFGFVRFTFCEFRRRAGFVYMEFARLGENLRTFDLLLLPFGHRIVVVLHLGCWMLAFGFGVLGSGHPMSKLEFVSCEIGVGLVYCACWIPGSWISVCGFRGIVAFELISGFELRI